jgi:metal transporter CNNM
VAVGEEGEPLDPRSVIRLPFRDGRPVFPEIVRRIEDPFLRQVADSGRKWVVLVDEHDEPRLVASAPALLRAALFDDGPFTPAPICHHPLVVRKAGRPLGQVLSRLTVQPERPGDDVIDRDLILAWVGNRRIITGSDLLGRLLRRIARPTAVPSI